MNIFEDRHHQNLWHQAVALAIEKAPQTLLKCGMQVVHINDMDTIFEIILTTQTHAKVKISNPDVETKGGATHTFRLADLININDILANYWLLKKKFENTNG